MAMRLIYTRPRVDNFDIPVCSIGRPPPLAPPPPPSFRERVALMKETIIPHALRMSAWEVEDHIDEITAFLEAGGIGPLPRDQQRVLTFLQAIWHANSDMHGEWLP